MKCLAKPLYPLVQPVRAVILLLCMAALPPATAQTPAVPEIPAFLPMVDSVPATQAMPLDGTWLVNTIRKKIRIEAGRAYAVDDWLHMFVLKVSPGMVVIRDITPTGPGAYSGQDLPLAGGWSAKVQADRSLSVSVAGLLGPANYKLIPIQLDNPQWYSQEMAAAGLSTPQQSYQPAQPAYQPAPPVYQSAPPAYQPVQPVQQQPVYQPPPAYQPAQPVQQQPVYQPPPTYQTAPPTQSQPPAYQPPPSAYQPAQPVQQQPPARYQPVPPPGSAPATEVPASPPVTDVGNDEYE